LDHHQLFKEIEALDLHWQEPRFECQVRAHFIGHFLQGKGLKAGRIWAMARVESEKLIAPLLDEHGKPFPAASWQVDSSDKLILSEQNEQRLEWSYHVAALDCTDHLHPVVYDPVMFSGPVSIWRWMSVFKDGTAVKFIRTDWHTGPRYNYMGSAYTPDYQYEHGPDDHQRADMDLKLLKSRSPHGVRYKRHSPDWR